MKTGMLRKGSLLVATLAPMAIIGQGCLTRPVESGSPNLNTNFTTVVHSTAIDKIDMLFVIDNSASMGDKQEYLAKAVPNLITRLVTPNCVDPITGKVYGQSDQNGQCAQGRVEFPPVHDLHIGIVSSSLGTRLSNTSGNGQNTLCDPNATIQLSYGTFNRHNDDKAELVNRSGMMQTPLPDAGTSNYLNYFPNVAKNMGKTPSSGAPPITDPQQLISDFTGMIQGVGVHGCGIESQLESWYRFLVQPDPYATMGVNNGGSHPQAVWQGIDTTILKQRSDFLRPDSLVAIVDLSDENDSEIDVRSLSGQGYYFMRPDIEPPRGTVGCNENASNSGLVDPSTCTSCAFVTNKMSDPNCAMNDDPNPTQSTLGRWGSSYEWGDNANLRHVQMLQKYGLWPQFPIERYSTGLQVRTVPDRRGEYPAGAGIYQGLNPQNRNCTNPLYAAKLPDGSGINAQNPTDKDFDSLCHLPPGPRTKDLVYYAHIGGVPHQLLQNQDGSVKETLGDADWHKILGKDPEHGDFTGQDVHMTESFNARPGMPTSLPGDSISGYDWVTDQPRTSTMGGAAHKLLVDREYACTFPLASPRDCTQADLSDECDCPSASGLTAGELPPICDPQKQTSQIGAKTYPTIRELLLAKLMGQYGLVSSMCPIDVQPAPGQTAQTDPLYGYNPAVNGIVDRLKIALNNQCLPQKLTPDQCGQVQCLVLTTLPVGSTCANTPGMTAPPADILARFQQQQHDAWVAGSSAGTDPSTLQTCEMQQLFQVPPGGDPSKCPTAVGQFDNGGSCQGSKQPGWCYVTGATAQGFGCPQSILYSTSEPPNGATISLQCIEQAVSALPDAGAGGG